MCVQAQELLRETMGVGGLVKAKIVLSQVNSARTACTACTADTPPGVGSSSSAIPSGPSSAPAMPSGTSCVAVLFCSAHFLARIAASYRMTCWNLSCTASIICCGVVSLVTMIVLGKTRCSHDCLDAGVRFAPTAAPEQVCSCLSVPMTTHSRLWQ